MYLLAAGRDETTSPGAEARLFVRWDNDWNGCCCRPSYGAGAFGDVTDNSRAAGIDNNPVSDSIGVAFTAILKHEGHGLAVSAENSIGKGAPTLDPVILIPGLTGRYRL